MKVSIFGSGSIGLRHLTNLIKLKKELKIKSIFAYDTKNKTKFLGKDKNFIFTQNLKEAADNCDVAFICVPTFLHNQTINKILKHTKCHFYIEKPLSSEIKDCLNTLKKIKKIKKKVGIGYMFVNHPLILRTQSLIKKKTIGRIIFARAECGLYLPNWHPWENYRKFYMAHKNQGGGVLLDTSHEINYLQRLFGNVKNVQGIVGKFSDLQITSDDLALSILNFKKNNIVAHVHLDLLQFERSRSFKIIGTKGTIEGCLSTNKLRIFNNNKKKWIEKKISYNFNNIYLTQLRQFWSLIKNKKNNLCTGNEAYHTMQIIEGIRSSNKFGKKIQIK
jgi:predicted dehydrogenase